MASHLPTDDNLLQISLRAVSETNSSLAPHLHATAHAPPYVERAALPDPDHFETAVAEGGLVYLLQRVRERNLLDFASDEAHPSDTLQAFRELNALEITAVLERRDLEPLQRGRQLDALQRGATKDHFLAVKVLQVLIRSQHLGALVKHRLLEARAVAERALVDRAHRGRHRDANSRSCNSTPA